MDISPLGVLRNWLPQLPSILRTALLSSIGQSSSSEHQDALTEIIVAAARPILQTPAPLLQSQRQWTRDPGIWGPMWIAKYTVPRPAEPDLREGQVLGVRDAVAFAIRELGQGHNDPECPMPDISSVETEWTGHRPGVSIVAPRPWISECEMYTRLMADTDPNGPTILYFHGGAFVLMDPSTHRLTTSSLAGQSGGRVLSVRYRLAPQHPFPAALLDAFITYLALLSPPPDSYHTPVSPSQIVFAGDSSGGGLAASLLSLLLTLSRHNIIITYNNTLIPIPTPPCAALALASPWLDISRSLPSTTLNAKYDIVAPPPATHSPESSPGFPHDEIWPSKPPRAETYAPLAEFVTHPLVSPLAATSEMWSGAPALYVNCGWEGGMDEIEVFVRRYYVATRAVSAVSLSGTSITEPLQPQPLQLQPDSHPVTQLQSQPQPEARSSPPLVVFEGHKGMPHCFAVIPWNVRARCAQSNWARFCANAVSSASGRETSISEGLSIHHPQTGSIHHNQADTARRGMGTWTDKHSHIFEVPLAQRGMGYEHCGYGPDPDHVCSSHDCHHEGNWRSGPRPLTDAVVNMKLAEAREWRVRIEREMRLRWKEGR